MERVFIIKIGGNVIDNEDALSSFLAAFSQIKGQKVLVHGGGKLATELAQQLHVPQQMIEGRRITDAETLKIVTMVYAGLINKKIVAQLQLLGCNAMGVTGADGNLIRSHKRIINDIDYGFVGDIDEINTGFLNNLFNEVEAIVVAPITHDLQGQLLNTNADTVAQELAKALTINYDVSLVYCLEKPGVLLDANNDSSVIAHIDKNKFEELKVNKAIYDGMIPKLSNAFTAVDSGVSKVIIGHAGQLNQLIEGNAGTTISN